VTVLQTVYNRIHRPSDDEMLGAIFGLRWATRALPSQDAQRLLLVRPARALDLSALMSPDAKRRNDIAEQRTADHPGDRDPSRQLHDRP
jgi:hypothetical protein